ncbi:MAG: twin-arginine translocase TatA/TatE family subunit [Anaerolineaceae bacterium]|jgi:Sec-independent protein translocase protein TatA|nr:twin-arginine translocase TatA/TatE family subunit [Anaerolineaceae bacterium]MDD4041925.1 twin-arginine translocase TatA/TatE family subunit [Anaerolineaceae bacterium]MDD4577935.1 twin-arginine translocase TatA/TatE family subunit [Anaerolineaceae bacterium]
MEFFNLGWTEIALILILAFIVLGPGKLVKVGRDLGDWIRKISREQLFRDVIQTTDEIRRYPRKIFDESLLDLPPHVQQQEKQASEPDTNSDAARHHPGNDESTPA